MALTSLDAVRLGDALMLAEQAIGRSDPNPRVGCVIGREDGSVLGRGSTQRAGEAHAEVMALRDAESAGRPLRGSTAWVTLEPCSHHGRTPPCCDALIDAGIARVVVATADPNPLVGGRGLERLRGAGLAVEVDGGEIAERSRLLNIGFFCRHQRGRPWVRMKVAISLDGRTALADGTSQWITGTSARTDGHAWRRRAGAVLTGIGTVLADDPRLDVRLVPTVLQPLRVVLDSQLRLPTTAALLAPPGAVLVVTRQVDGVAADSLRAMGSELWRCGGGAAGGLDLKALMDELGRRAINEVHVEAGATLNGALLKAGLVDELLAYCSPRLIGPGRPLADLPALASLADTRTFEWSDASRIGEDLRLRLIATGARGLPMRREH